MNPDKRLDIIAPDLAGFKVRRTVPEWELALVARVRRVSVKNRLRLPGLGCAEFDDVREGSNLEYVKITPPIRNPLNIIPLARCTYP